MTALDRDTWRLLCLIAAGLLVWSYFDSWSRARADWDRTCMPFLAWYEAEYEAIAARESWSSLHSIAEECLNVRGARAP